MSLKIGQRIGLCAVAMPLFLGGCGYEGVQLNGKVFDIIGLNGPSAQKGDPELAARQPLALPLSGSLPSPGSGKADQPALADIQDHDKYKKASHAELEKQQAEYCRENYEKPLAYGDSSADTVSGPLGSCRPSVFTAIQKWMAGSANQDDSDDDSQMQ